MDATRAALRCGMCGARAGLWDFVPKMVPTAQSGRQLGSPSESLNFFSTLQATVLSNLGMVKQWISSL